jgi:hypothetical protein
LRAPSALKRKRQSPGCAAANDENSSSGLKGALATLHQRAKWALLIEELAKDLDLNLRKNSRGIV